MIGVIPKPNQVAVVEEFFQLFKTPWEFYKKGHTYDVVLCPPGEIPEVEAGLLVIHGCATASHDTRAGIRAGCKVRDVTAQSGGDRFPIYGETLLFEQTNLVSSCIACDSGAAAVLTRSDELTI